MPAPKIQLEFQLSENMKIKVIPSRIDNMVQITHNENGKSYMGFMTDKKEIAKLIVALNALIR